MLNLIWSKVTKLLPIMTFSQQSIFYNKELLKIVIICEITMHSELSFFFKPELNRHISGYETVFQNRLQHLF